MMSVSSNSDDICIDHVDIVNSGVDILNATSRTGEADICANETTRKNMSVQAIDDYPSKKLKHCSKEEIQNLEVGFEGSCMGNSLLDVSYELPETNVDDSKPSTQDDVIELLYGKTEQEMKSCYEMGYFCLEKCRVVMHRMKPARCVNVVKEWEQVNVTYGKKLIEQVDEFMESSSTKSSALEVAEQDMSNDANYCSFCQVNVYERNSVPTKMYHIDLPEIESFDGNVDHVNCLRCKKKRPDLSLLLGMLRFCQEIVVIKSCYVLLDSSNEFADFIITVTFPYWFLLDDTKSGQRTILPSSLPSFKSCHVLHPSTQCLLSLVRSDWKKLEDHMLQKVNNQRRLEQKSSSLPTITLFPTRLALEEVYKSMRSDKQVELNLHSVRKQPTNDLNETSAHSIPIEIWETRIAPFLRAKSLDTLRCTCKYFFGSLAHVVPGLRPSIRLYRHQIASLLWMRQRETKLITEQDCLQTNESSTASYLSPEQYDYTEDDDYHRVVTGGCTARLAVRKLSSLSESSNSLSMQQTADASHPMQGVPLNASEKVTYIYEEIRIDQLNGKEVLTPTENLASREVARGGLLCDDPGLGTFPI